MKNNKYIFLFLIFLLGVFGIFIVQSNQMINIILSVIGSNSQNDIIQKLFEGFNQADIQSGLNYLKEIGYSTVGIRYLYHSILFPYIIMLIILIILFMIALLGLNHYESKNKEKQINQLVDLVLNESEIDIEDKDFQQLVDVIKEKNKLILSKEKEFNLMNQKQLTYLENVAHQIKTALSSLILLQEMNFENEDINDNKENISESLNICTNINQIVTQLMKAGKLRSNYNNLNFASINLVDLLQDCVSQLKIKYTTIKFNFYYLDNYFIYADYVWLKEAFVNILDNCGRYGPKNSEIKITLIRENNKVKTVIEDEGCGISNEEIDFLFNRFHHNKEEYNDIYFGIGLHLAKDIIDAHWGNIEVKKREEKGTKFEVTFSQLLTE